jgi:hypothetical protein
MVAPKIWVFFYGSYMNLAVLREVELIPDGVEAARVAGWAIDIRPRANMVRSPLEAVHGVLARATHAELARLYAHAHDVLGEIYLPEAVLAETPDGRWRAALCYICPEMLPRPAENAYVGRIADAAREHGLPAAYVARLESFRPRTT